MSKHPDVVVIGGGIIGLTSAYFLAEAGFAVEVLDRTDLGREASWAGAGIIPPGNPDRAAAPADKLRAIGSARFPALSADLRARTGIDNGYLRCGAVEFLRPADEYVLPLWRAEGVAVERLTLGGLKRIEPAVGEVSGEPYLLPDCAQVRNPWHVRALIAACEGAGVRLRPHEPVWHLGTAGHRVAEVSVERGRPVSAGAVLIAAGAWSEHFLAELGHRPNVHPVRGQIALFKPSRPVLSRVLMFGKEYLVPRGDGRVLVGSTEEPEAGFEKMNTPAAVAKLTALATRTVPPLADAPVEKCWAGLRPGSPDGLPFIGRVPGYDNVFVAAGHFRAGIQLSIGTAQLIAELLRGIPPSVPLDAFRLDREPGVGVQPAFRS
ncbi:MAG: hcnC [Gemmataceae bacterium]|nr:hcnC [Gemmataceae bacterium]